MTTSLEDLPPKWRQNMQQRRACLLRFESERALTVGRARSIAEELADVNGEGDWECDAVKLDAAGRDWELRFKPYIEPATRPTLRSVPR